MEQRRSGDKAAEPLNIAVDATFELDRFVETAWQGLSFAEHAVEISKILAESPGRHRPKILKPADLERATKLEAFAAAQKPHFPFLYSLAAFRLWAILETAVEDLVRLWLLNDSVRNRPPLISLEGSLVEFAAASRDEQCDILLTRLKQKLSANLKRGIGRFESLLDAVGLGGPVVPSVRRVLMELSEVRNVVAHKNGRIDKRFLEHCTWPDAVAGNVLVIGPSHFAQFIVAAHWYLIELSRRSESLDPGKDPAETAEYLERLAHSLEQAESTLSKMQNSQQADDRVIDLSS